MPPIGPWREWAHKVLSDVERLESVNVEQSNKIAELRAQVRALQVKAGVFGAIGGAIPVVIVLAVYLIKSM